MLLLGTSLVGCSSSADGFFGDVDDEDRVEPPRHDGGVTARDAGSPSLDSGRAIPPARLQGLITADRPPPPLSGGTLAVAPDGSFAVAADPDRDAIYVVGELGSTKATIQLAQGSEPGRVTLDGRGRAHVALRGTGKLVTIDLAGASVLQESDVCPLPRGVAYDAQRDAVVVACASGQLVTLAAAGHEVLQQVELDLDLRDPLVREDGTLQVSRYRSAELLELASDGKVLARHKPNAAKQSSFEQGFEQLPDGGTVFRPPSRLTLTFEPTLAWRTVRAEDGSSLMLHQVSQVDEIVLQESGGYGGGCQTITQAGITRYDADGHVGAPVTLASHGLIVDVAVSSDGKLAAFAEPGGYLRGSTTFEVVQIDHLLRSAAEDAEVPTAPPMRDADGGLVPPHPGSFSPGVASCVSGTPHGHQVQATSVAFDGDDMLYVFSREPARLTVYRTRHPERGVLTGLFESWSVELDDRSVRDTGHELFHADVGQGLSCAGCHGEALDDGHVWNFRDFGPRRTQTMRGGLLSTLPLHWEGDMPTFKHLVDEVMTRRMGGFMVEERYATALANWIDQLPPLRTGVASSESATRGKALFESPEVGCATCHSGPQLTNDTSVDVGTGEVLQVPALLGLGMRAPYMHDGCARTLHERFDPECGGGDQHGKTSQLDAAQIDDLVHYLETL